MWGYPITPLLFIGITAWFLVNISSRVPCRHWQGFALIVAGFPVFYIWAAARVMRHTLPIHARVPVARCIAIAANL